MKKQLKIKTVIVLNDFEKVSESQKKLVGGFSSSFHQIDSIKIDDGSTNNCNGGNCVSGCGTGQNVNCNSTLGCGE